MNARPLGHFGLLCLFGALAVGCSDAAQGPADVLPAGGTASTASAGSGSGGQAVSTAGAAGSATQVGGSAGESAALGGAGSGGGGGVGGVAGVGGGVAGSGGMIPETGGASTGPASGRQTARPLGTVPGTNNGYWEYLPPHYGNGSRYPLLIFGHGSGENGTGSLQDLQKVLNHGPPKLAKADQWPDTRPFIVLSPQHNPAGAAQCPSPEEVDAFMTFALSKYDVDPKRVYLTGLSCGGHATWNYLGAHSDERVAAAVPICGDGRPAFQKIGCQLGKVPIWAFHGEADDQVAPAGSIEAIKSLKACTNPPAVDVRITTYPGVKHDSWTMTYDLSNPANDIYAWMLSHQKP
jgi:poly(3-hydroxybutyrate) depolymerase